MLTTLRGRVESDPMGVPAPATMAAGRDESFAAVLQQTEADAPAAEAEPEPAVAPQEPAAASPEPGPADARELPPEPAADPAQAAAETAAPREAARQVVAGADATETIRRGEPARQETAGKGTDSPRAFSPSAEPLLAAIVAHGARQAPAAAGPANPGVPGVNATTAAGEAQGRGAAASWQTAGTQARAAAVAAGYRTDPAASARLLEHARDSVFKQILMQLHEGGGEMRVRLEPPELGELDLRLVVEGGNRLSLSIAAERQELAQLLQRHLDGLKQTLQAAGLEVTDAEVHTRDGGRRDRGRDGWDGAAGERRDETAPLLPRLGGYVGAEGLDFWV